MDASDRCQRYDEDLSAFLDAELDARRESEVRAHLASCARCRDRVDALRRVDVELAALPTRPVSAELRARLAARIAGDGVARRRAPRRVTPARRPGWPALSAGAAAAAAAAFALYVAVGGGESPQPGEAPRLAGSVVPGLDTEPADEVALALNLDTIQDMEVIANLELLEALLVLEEGTG